MQARMLVAMHKAAEVPSDSFYLPVQVGHALNTVDLGIQPDDEGASISHLNRSYCELTALYWAWKNLEADIVGLSHYRRYFIGEQPGPNGQGILSERDAKSLMGAYDIVLSRPRNYYIETIESHYRNGHHGQDLDILRGVIATRSPQYLDAYDRVLRGRKLSLYNMFLMRRELFDAYMEWVIGILSECELRIDNTPRSPYQQRTFGYMSERLLNVWVRHTTPRRVGYRRVVNTDGDPKVRKALAMLRRKHRLGGLR